MDIDKIVAEMPKSENHHKCYCDKYSPHTMTKGQIVRDARYHEWNEATKAQCQLLAEQGWGKVLEDAKVPQRRKYIPPPGLMSLSMAVAKGDSYLQGQIDAQQGMLEAGWRKVE